MKKWLSLFCVLFLTITATACNAQSESVASERSSVVESSIQSDTLQTKTSTAFEDDMISIAEITASSSIESFPAHSSIPQSQATVLAPLDTATLTETEQFFLDFAYHYSLSMEDVYFTDAEALSNKEKYQFFDFVQNFINIKKQTPNELEATLYRPEEEAVVIPVSTIREWLRTYLGTDQFDPSKVQLFSTDDSQRKGLRPFGYDSAKDVFLAPSLSGFGGVRACGVLHCKITGQQLEMELGFYNPDLFYSKPPEYEMYKQVTLQVKQSDDPLQFQLLSWESRDLP